MWCRFGELEKNVKRARRLIQHISQVKKARGQGRGSSAAASADALMRV